MSGMLWNALYPLHLILTRTLTATLERNYYCPILHKRKLRPREAKDVIKTTNWLILFCNQSQLARVNTFSGIRKARY